MQPPSRPYTLVADRVVRNQASTSQLFVFVGLGAEDPGYSSVMEAIRALGTCTSIGESIWLVDASQPGDRAFLGLNKCMLDRRIDSSAELLVVDTSSRSARWYLGSRASAALAEHWLRGTNLFIQFAHAEGACPPVEQRQVMERMGVCAHVCDQLWYLSTPLSWRAAIATLIECLEACGSMIVFDDAGHLVTCHTYGHGDTPPTSRQPATRQDRGPKPSQLQTDVVKRHGQNRLS